MSTTDNYSHKEEKADHSAIKKPSGMENEEEKREPGTFRPDQLGFELSKRCIKVTVEQCILYGRCLYFFFLVNSLKNSAIIYSYYVPNLYYLQ